MQTPTDRSSRGAWSSADLGTLLALVGAAHGDRLALDVADEPHTYAALFGHARRIAALLLAVRGDGAKRVAIVGSRSAGCFAGVLGALFSGAAYVPLNAKFPLARTAHMLTAAAASALVVEKADLTVLAPALRALAQPLAIIVVDAAAEMLPDLGNHRVFRATDVIAAAPVPVPAVAPDDLAYLMFTSGSTGVPKGVMVSHRNVLACMASFGDRYAIGPDDRFSQNFELTFDLSVFDMFLCWLHGASLHVAAPAQQAAPAKLVAKHALTVWFSVPSMGLFLMQLRALKPNAFPSLRWSLFCGERLPLTVAEAFADAAPASIVENLYGPTEVTIACTVHRFDRAISRAISRQEAVPIGAPLPGLGVAIIDDEGAPTATGELCMSGPQVALGYWQDAAKTSDKFVHLPKAGDPATRWYRTGDVVVALENGELAHLGRADDQVKVRGYRVELGEVEVAIRRLVGTEAVSVVAIRGRSPDVVELVAFIAAAFDEDATRDALVDALPAYMQPAALVAVATLPLSSNGKTDKNELSRRYREAHEKP